MVPWHHGPHSDPAPHGRHPALSALAQVAVDKNTRGEAFQVPLPSHRGHALLPVTQTGGRNLARRANANTFSWSRLEGFAVSDRRDLLSGAQAARSLGHCAQAWLNTLNVEERSKRPFRKGSYFLGFRPARSSARPSSETRSPRGRPSWPPAGSDTQNNVHHTSWGRKRARQRRAATDRPAR